MKYLQAIIVTSIFLLLCVPVIVLGAEECSLFRGACKEACAPNEKAEAGAFLDCTDSQECCVKEEAPAPVKCCVHSFDSKAAGPSNCSEPVQDACPKGAGLPLPCAKLKYCN
ncbi:MAG: hypothetical protein A2X56_06580 [Nitrospirae bacterium GWC2_57_13]|jgi:hypothetical protein|nr:MAG: hypothetical protein A2X56_06580 [Nitrospirae bacterium GWC2_57_13]OGW45497.1 MAG: hypothetical protein A2X57_05410 [Nitrospirae bacterium GWD2_57_8]HAS54049.1 hypothetical protein [Nitrospiraceae bacterium]